MQGCMPAGSKAHAELPALALRSEGAGFRVACRTIRCLGIHRHLEGLFTQNQKYIAPINSSWKDDSADSSIYFILFFMSFAILSSSSESRAMIAPVPAALPI